MKNITREEYKTRLIGKTFGELKVVEFYGYDKWNQIIYRCKCSCGSETFVTYSKLNRGVKTHCGCLTSKKMSDARRKYNTYDLSGNYGVGLTSNTNIVFKFDLEDYEKIKDQCWLEKDDYIQARHRKTGKQIKMHRVIMSATHGEIIDHINHDGLDNRKDNLRKVTNQQNARNHKGHKNNTSGITGVGFEKDSQKWRARIFIDAKGKHLGRFEEKEDAIIARLNAEVKYFGIEFAPQRHLFKKYKIKIGDKDE